MGILVVLAIGTTLGWLAGILTHTRSRHGYGANIAVGVAGALMAGGMASLSFLEGVTPASLGATLLGTVLFLTVVNLVWHEPGHHRGQTPPMHRLHK